MDQDGNPGIRDFFVDETPKRFRVHRDGDVFEAPPVLGPVQILELVALSKNVSAMAATGDPSAAVKAIQDVFDEILTEDSAAKFAALLVSRDRPIDLQRQIVPILLWLLEEYGMRPTAPSSDSSNISTADGGTSSTDGAPPSESTPSTAG